MSLQCVHVSILLCVLASFGSISEASRVHLEFASSRYVPKTEGQASFPSASSGLGAGSLNFANPIASLANANQASAQLVAAENAALAVHLAAQAPVPTQAPCVPQWNELTPQGSCSSIGTDAPKSNDLGVSVEECKTRCVNDLECVGIETYWQPWPPSAGCEIHTVIDNSVASSGFSDSHCYRVTRCSAVVTTSPPPFLTTSPPPFQPLPANAQIPVPQAVPVGNVTEASVPGVVPMGVTPAAGPCAPQCRWKCDNPQCDQVCTPVCEAPRCETRCQNADTARCQMDCSQQQCQVMCPQHQCAAGHCAKCTTQCSAPLCFFKCPEAQKCRNVCEEPRCDWKCSKPLSCPKPKCQMVCDNPANCPHTTFHKELPAPAVNEVRVQGFSANAGQQGQPVVPSQTYATNVAGTNAGTNAGSYVVPVAGPPAATYATPVAVAATYATPVAAAATYATPVAGAVWSGNNGVVNAVPVYSMQPVQGDLVPSNHAAAAGGSGLPVHYTR